MPEADLCDWAQRLPKAELHVHLDGSLRPETMIELAASAGEELPTNDPETLRRYMLVDDARDLPEYLARFEYTISLLQTPEAIARVAEEMVIDAAGDGLSYLEIRYCPELSTRQGLTLDQVLQAEWEGVRRGTAATGVEARIINCSLRHYDPEISVKIAEASVDNRHNGVVGFDLAGGEAGSPPQVHHEAFDLAARGGLGITVHAGEAAGWESIFEAIHSCRATRLGHGTRLFENPDLLAYVRDRRILIETNITSNVQTHAVESAASHPVRQYFDAGIAVTLCTDSWLMSGVSLSDEYRLAHDALGFTFPELRTMATAAFEHAFLPWPERREMIARAGAASEDTA